MKKKNKFIFTQDCGILSNEIFVCAGATKEEVLMFVKDKKNNFKKDIKNHIEKLKCWELLNDNNEALVSYDDNLIFMLLKKVENNWTYWETLLHETHHIVEIIARQKMAQDEMELKAYLQGYLFRNIRRKLQGVDKIL